MKEDGPANERQLRALLVAVFLISFSLIAFEISLSRLLSALLSYHYVFVVLSLALLGIGLGGMIVLLFGPAVSNAPDKFATLPFISSFFSLSIPLSVIILLLLGYLDNPRINILVYGTILIIPFLLAGALFTEIFRTVPALSSRVYGADLMGAAAGSIGAILLLNMAGGIGTHLVLGVAASLGALALAMGFRKQGLKKVLLPVLSFFILSILLGVNIIGGPLLDLKISANPGKEIYDALSSFKGKIVETRWSAFGRTDLVKFSDYPDHMDIYIDGTAGSPMYRFSGNAGKPGSAVTDLKSTFPGYFPFLFLKEEERDSALIIGPGGGRDVLLALMGGVQRVTAVEVNRDLVEMVRRYALFNGGIYKDLDNVDVLVDEGRSFLRREGANYDIIMLSLPVTHTSRSPEGYALTENFLFTTDSVRDYLDHLTNEGRLVVVAHNDAEALRLLSISLATLEEMDVKTSEAMRRVYIVGSDDYLVFVLKKIPFARTEIPPMYRATHGLGLEGALSYFPYIGRMGAINPALMALGHGRVAPEEFVKLVAERGYDISPITDDSPFFYKLNVGMPKPVLLALWSSAILFVLIVLIPPLFLRRKILQGTTLPKKARFRTKEVLRSAGLFAMIGIGFMMVEISFAQKFVLFLGRPVMSLAVLLFSLLCGAGLGSIWSGRFSQQKTKSVIALVSLSIAVFILGYAFSLPLIFNQLLGLDTSLRLLIAVLLLIPLGFLMGIPFPSGIRWLKEQNLEGCIPWMWGINGVCSVLGSALTVVVAISFGFTKALYVGALCYLIVFAMFRRSKEQ